MSLILKSEVIGLLVFFIGFQIVYIGETNGIVVRKIINTPFAPSPGGLPLSQAVQVGDMIYISGQLGMTLEGIIPEGIVSQTRIALQNIGYILTAANSNYTSVVKTTVLLANITDSPAMSEVYGQFFSTKHPARAAYQVGHLPFDALVEIEAVAISGEIVDA